MASPASNFTSNSTNNSTTRRAPTTSENVIPVLIVVGAAITILIVVVVVWCCCIFHYLRSLRRRVKTKKKKKSKSNKKGDSKTGSKVKGQKHTSHEAKQTTSKVGPLTPVTKRRNVQTNENVSDRPPTVSKEQMEKIIKDFQKREEHRGHRSRINGSSKTSAPNPDDDLMTPSMMADLRALGLGDPNPEEIRSTLNLKGSDGSIGQAKELSAIKTKQKSGEGVKASSSSLEIAERKPKMDHDPVSHSGSLTTIYKLKINKVAVSSGTSA